MRRAATLAGPLVLLVLLVAVWEWYVRSRGLGYVLPAPSDVARALRDERESLAHDTAATLVEVLSGFAVALALGVLTAVALHASDLLRRAAYPLLVASQSVPLLALAPLLVIWLGFGLGPKLVVVALLCFFPITVGMLDGLRSVDPDLLRMMRTLHGGRLDVFRRVELPWSLPSLFSGLRVAAAYAAVAAMFAEYAGGASHGLGVTMQTAQSTGDAALVGAAVVLLSVLALALFGAVTLLERLLVPWAREPVRR
jgi:putative hydroxymethylpyrimidine transport system permease protein